MRTTARQLEHAPHFVYTFWRGNQPLYVGCTSNLRARMKDHKATTWMQRATWVAWVEFPDLGSGRAAEAGRIQKLRPFYNIHCNRPRWQSVVEATQEEMDYREWCDQVELLDARSRRARSLAPAIHERAAS